MYTAAEAGDASGIKEIWDAIELAPFLRSLRNRESYRPKPENIFMSSISASLTVADGLVTSGFEKVFEAVAKNEAELYMLAPGEGETREYRPEQRFISEWTKTPSGYNVKNAAPIFAEMRLRKSPLELELMQHAIDITTEAHERSWAAAGDAKWEYEVDAQVAYTFKLRNADHWGYPSIVGCGPNATTLHYIESQGQVKPGDLMLMDVGAEYEHYTADVTRTFPVNGKFSPAQAELYQIVYDAQEAGAKAARPGMVVSDVNRAATEVIKDGLLKLGLITDRNSGQYRIWFMHGTSHWLGMNVHDVGNYGAKLEPGMTFTNEPGIYVRPDALDNLPKTAENEKFIAAIRPAFEKYKGIGVRIEDDMVITPDGVKWMTEALPRKIADIEAFMARARVEARR
jgi:Xaa-Pro aminopeptidase